MKAGMSAFSQSRDQHSHQGSQSYDRENRGRHHAEDNSGGQQRENRHHGFPSLSSGSYGGRTGSHYDSSDVHRDMANATSNSFMGMGGGLGGITDTTGGYGQTMSSTMSSGFGGGGYGGTSGNDRGPSHGTTYH